MRSTAAGRARVPAAIGMVALLVAALLGGILSPVASAAQGQCGGSITPAQTEGPFYTPGSPERTSLIEPGMKGTRMAIAGQVLDRNCAPLAHAWLDFWQTDAAGVYDNTGFRLRGHQYTDSSGRYRLETIVPGEYPGRTPHIHVKVRPEGGSVLTTQLYFPMSPSNEKDGLYDPLLLVRLQDAPGGFTGTFNFVLNVTGPQPPQPAPPSSSDSFTFAETGITVAGDFWTMWQGGRSFADSLFINGLPITPEREETSPSDGKVYRTQWFERARFEYHPENPTPSNVLLGLLGTAAVQGRLSEAPFARVENPGKGLAYFPQTGHTLGDGTEGGRAIAALWNRLGGLTQFGYPISQPFTETSKEDGKQYVVQYFERQRFEYHPENRGTPFEVLLGRLGAEQVETGD